MSGVIKAKYTFSTLLLALVSCGFPRPPALADDASAVPVDAGTVPDSDADIPALPGTSVHVSPSGNDANDGLIDSVRTIRRALAVASANSNITAIALEAGRHGTDTGETFPYMIPEGLTFIGSLSGDAVVAGTGSETGLVLGSGVLQRLRLENFSVAVLVTGTTRLNAVRVLSSKLAVSEQGAAILRLENVDVTGIDIATTGGGILGCSTGIRLRDSASVMANGLSTRGLRAAVDAGDLSTVIVNSANITQDSQCTGTGLLLNTSMPVAVSESQIAGGSVGIWFLNPTSSSALATVTNAKILNMPSPLAGAAVVFRMIGGEISGSSGEGLSTTGGSWSFTNVTIKNNTLPGIYAQGNTVNGVSSFTHLTMRGCTITGNSNGGISLADGVIVDLGTDLDPGSNTIQGNSGIGIVIFGTRPQQISAVGNTWNANVQGADSNGRYLSTTTVTGPVDFIDGGNYELSSGVSIRR